MAKETFGQRLKRLREAKGLSQAKLAVAAGVSAGSLRNAEYDRREPLIGLAAKIAAALGVTLDELVGHASPPADAPAPQARPAAKGRRKPRP